MVQYAFALSYDLLFPADRLVVDARDNSYTHTVSAGFSMSSWNLESKVWLLDHPFIVACRVNASMEIITWLFETLKDGSVNPATVRYLYYPECMLMIIHLVSQSLALFFACMHDNLPLITFLIENGWQKFIRMSVEGRELMHLVPYGQRRSLGIDRFSEQIDLTSISR